MKKEKKLILWFEETNIKDTPLVGGKNSSLGEMYVNLVPKGIRIPNGFAITAEAYRYFIKQNGLDSKIKNILADLDTSNMENLSSRGYAVREAILASQIPDDLRQEIAVAYKKLSDSYYQKGGHKDERGGEGVDVAIRSSATAEDLADASFAGQQESYLNIRGIYLVLESVKKCFASLFTNRAISYREDKGFNHFQIALSVGVQNMVRSDEAVSGVMFTIDTESGFEQAIIINSSYGLGENIVKGKVTPDEFIVHKPTLREGFRPIIGRRIGSKTNKLVYSLGGNQTTREVKVPIEDRRKFSLTDEEILQMAQWGAEIEEYYKRPMDIEWAKDGKDGQLYVVQARPETVHSQKNKNYLENYILQEKGEVLCIGAAVGNKIGQGKVRVIKNVSGISEFQKGEVLVTEMTDPDWEPIMKIASAIVTNSGGRTSHAAIVSRELGIPCLVGTGNSTKVLKTGQEVTVCCAEGEKGKIYDGVLKFEVQRTNLKEIKRPKVKIMMNVGNPEQAFENSFIPNDGVGLAREEFIITEYIKIHPLALIHFDSLENPQVKDQIEKITSGYKNKKSFYVEKLAEGIGRIAAGFYPKDVIVRLADFKTNEYATLIGGGTMEPNEQNPMIGWRGASRYYDERFLEAFKLECEALRKIREDMGFKNVKIMIPFCRTIEEGKKVQEIMKDCGLERGKDGLELYVMCEIPSNVVLAREFAQIFDGFSIGSNDLTQLTLGVDRDNSLIAHVYDERNEAVKSLIRQVIKDAHDNDCKIGICGQAPSDFLEFAKFLMEENIDSMSLIPDSVIKTTVELGKMEGK